MAQGWPWLSCLLSAYPVFPRFWCYRLLRQRRYTYQVPLKSAHD